VERLVAALGLSKEERDALVAAARERKPETSDAEPAPTGPLESAAGEPRHGDPHRHLYEEGFSSVPYLPFLEALREYVQERSVAELRDELGSLAPELGRILPDVCEKLALDPRPTRDPEEDRWRLLNAVTDFLRMAPRRRPSQKDSAT
jgi:hypothetical protein